MKITGIPGSSRKGGNTEVLLDLALEEAQKAGARVSKIALRDKMISLIHADPKFPEGFDTPLHRFVGKTIW